MIYHDLTGLTIPPDGANLRAVRGSHYKAPHRSPDFLLLALSVQSLNVVSGEDTWAVPLARTEWKGVAQHRVRVPMLYVDYVRLVVNILAVGKGTLSAWASNDNGATWASLDGASGPHVSLNTPLPVWSSDPASPRYDDFQPAAVLDSGWVKVSGTVRAFADPLIRLVGEAGDGAIATKFGSVLLYGR